MQQWMNIFALKACLLNKIFTAQRFAVSQVFNLTIPIIKLHYRSLVLEKYIQVIALKLHDLPMQLSVSYLMLNLQLADFKIWNNYLQMQMLAVSQEAANMINQSLSYLWLYLCSCIELQEMQFLFLQSINSIQEVLLLHISRTWF